MEEERLREAYSKAPRQRMTGKPGTTGMTTWKRHFRIGTGGITTLSSFFLMKINPLKKQNLNHQNPLPLQMTPNLGPNRLNP